ncbi:hypothetical protein JQR85_11760 [Stutzerimonas urumqiensis]|uniref:hypothetical protein n=1 Tax=Stutzerimonas urumqiensis TaxID=638269 RepID=UPI000EAE1015|nr:hypothetical protein [Stutzerimonas urumqiensis]
MNRSIFPRLCLSIALASAAGLAIAADLPGDGMAGVEVKEKSIVGDAIGRDVDDVGVDSGTDTTDGTASTEGVGIGDGLYDNGPTPRIGEAPDDVDPGPNEEAR